MPVDDESCLRICIAASKIQRHCLTISSTIDMRIKQALPMQTCGKSVTALHVSVRMGSRHGCRSVSPWVMVATASDRHHFAGFAQGSSCGVGLRKHTASQVSSAAWIGMATNLTHELDQRRGAAPVVSPR